MKVLLVALMIVGLACADDVSDYNAATSAIDTLDMDLRYLAQSTEDVIGLGYFRVQWHAQEGLEAVAKDPSTGLLDYERRVEQDYQTMVELVIKHYNDFQRSLKDGIKRLDALLKSSSQ